MHLCDICILKCDKANGRPQEMPGAALPLIRDPRRGGETFVTGLLAWAGVFPSRSSPSPSAVRKPTRSYPMSMLVNKARAAFNSHLSQIRAHLSHSKNQVGLWRWR